VGASKTKVYCEDQMTIDAIRGEAMMTDHIGSWQSITHCAALKACQNTLIADGTYSPQETEACIEASAFCPPRATLNTNGVENCDKWRVCIQRQNKARSIVMVIRDRANQEPLSQGLNLLQQNSGRREAIDLGTSDIVGCHANPFDHSPEDCDCFHNLEMHCTLNGANPLDGEPLFQCMKQQLCENPNVCCSWKEIQCTDIMTDTELAEDAACSTNLLAVHDNGKTEKATLFAELNDMKKSALQKRALAMRISKEMIDSAIDGDDFKAALIKLIVKADMSRTADAMHGRRQTPGSNSSFHHAELDQSISGKAASATCR